MANNGNVTTELKWSNHESDLSINYIVGGESLMITEMINGNHPGIQGSRITHGPSE